MGAAWWAIELLAVGGRGGYSGEYASGKRDKRKPPLTSFSFISSFLFLCLSRLLCTAVNCGKPWINYPYVSPRLLPHARPVAAQCANVSVNKSAR